MPGEVGGADIAEEFAEVVLEFGAGEIGGGRWRPVFAIVACPSLEDRGQGPPIDIAVAFGRTNGKGVVIDITRLNGGGFGDMEQMDKGEQQESIENHWNGGWVCGQTFLKESEIVCDCLL